MRIISECGWVRDGIFFWLDGGSVGIRLANAKNAGLARRKWGDSAASTSFETLEKISVPRDRIPFLVRLKGERDKHVRTGRVQSEPLPGEVGVFGATLTMQELGILEKEEEASRSVAYFLNLLIRLPGCTTHFVISESVRSFQFLWRPFSLSVSLLLLCGSSVSFHFRASGRFFVRSCDRRRHHVKH